MAMAMQSGARRRGRRSRTPISEINVTPFVDVMLVLLIIFMVTAPLLTAGVPIELPESRAKALSEEKLQVTISIASDGAVFVEERPVPLTALPATLASLTRTADGKPPLITLRGDKRLDYGTVMTVMGELNRAGFNSISLVTNASVSAPGQDEPEPTLSSGSGAEP